MKTLGIIESAARMEVSPSKRPVNIAFLNQSAISVVILISFLCYCGDYAGYITVILPFLAFYFCSAYFLYLVYYILYNDRLLMEKVRGTSIKKHRG
jgi:hypothetical protein